MTAHTKAPPPALCAYSQDDASTLHQQVSFPANSASTCDRFRDPDCGSNGYCNTCTGLVEAHDSCDIRNPTWSKDASDTITTSFSGYVNRATAGCCQAHSCVGSYIESHLTSIPAGEKVYFDYQAT